MRDGLYRVETHNITAGFIVKDGKVMRCAPILRRKLKWWMRDSEWVCE